MQYNTIYCVLFKDLCSNVLFILYFWIHCKAETLWPEISDRDKKWILNIGISWIDLFYNLSGYVLINHNCD